MKTVVSEDQAKLVIGHFVGWAKNTQQALISGKNAPECSGFVLLQLMPSLCYIHRQRTLADEKSGKTKVCNGHKYLYIALRLACEMRITAKTDVSMVLREIFLCEGSLNAVFKPLMYEFRRIDPQCILYRGEGQVQRSDLEYYFRSISPLERDVREKKGKIFTRDNVLNKGMRDGKSCPLLEAIKVGDTDLVLLMLRHGADPLLFNDEIEDLGMPPKSPVAFAVNQLNMLTLAMLSRRPPPTPPQSDNTHDRLPAVDEAVVKTCKCLAYLSRALFYLDARESIYVNRRARIIFVASRYKVPPQIKEIIDFASLCQPPTLRHACRCVIRCAVTYAGRDTIPKALKQLEIPSHLIEYLDLRF